MSKANELQELGIFKVGMEVYLNGRNYKGIKEVLRITDGRNGTIYVGRKGASDEFVFDHHGVQRATDTWNKIHIYPATDEHRKSLKISIAKNRLAGMNWFELDDDVAIELYEIIKARKVFRG